MGNLLTVREVADRLRVSERTIRKRVAGGELSALKLGPEQHAPIRISEGALVDFLRPANGRSEPRPDPRSAG
jgi:excisionase family DNA binding protein